MSPRRSGALNARYTMQRAQLLEECQVAPEVFAPAMPRARTFLAPCVAPLQGQAPRAPAQPSVRGWRAEVARQHVAALAEHFGQARLGVPGCSGGEDGEAAPVRHTRWSPVGQPVGPTDGVRGCDPAAWPTAGRASVGGARPWGGQRGPRAQGPGALSVGDVSRQGPTRVDRRCSLPQAWPQEKARLDTAGMPHAPRGSRPRHPGALARLAPQGAALPQRWRAGDEARGRPAWGRRRARGGERSRLAVPAPPPRRALETPPPAYGGPGRPPPRPWQSVMAWRQARAEGAGRRLTVRAGAHGPRGGAVVQRRGGSRPQRRPPGDEAVLTVRRSRDRAQEAGVHMDASRSTTVPETALEA
jgi:hypothetical protein